MNELVDISKEQQQPMGMMQVASSREAQGIQGAMVIAQKFPRDTNRAYTRVMEDCRRKSLAMKSVYSYPRGGSTVTGPSIRLAECMARAWGNLDFGITELERKPAVGSLPGESVVQAHCWDLETNTKSTTIFTVRHARDKNVKVNGTNKKIQEVLTDERDIYEMVANLGARRLRARILAIIPVDIVEAAVAQCQKTIKDGIGPLVDEARDLLLKFKNYGVTQDMVEKYLGHTLDAISKDEIVELHGVGNALREGAKREEFFELPKVEEEKAEAAKEAKQEAPPQGENTEPSAAAPASSEPAKEKKGKNTKTLKNFAPANAEQAKDWKPGDHNVEERAVDPEVDQKEKRQAAIKAILAKQKLLNWSNDSLAGFVKSNFKKDTNQLTTDELLTVPALMDEVPK